MVREKDSRPGMGHKPNSPRLPQVSRQKADQKAMTRWVNEGGATLPRDKKKGGKK